MKTHLILSGLLLAALPLFGCSDSPADKADRAARDVQEQRDDLATSRDQLGERHGDTIERGAAVGEQAGELASAEANYTTRRDAVVAELRPKHRVFAMQASIARGLLADPGLTEPDRQQATDQALNFERELAEAEQAIDALALASPEQWDVVHRTAMTAMTQLEGAHDDLWDALSVERILLRPS